MGTGTDLASESAGVTLLRATSMIVALNVPRCDSGHKHNVTPVIASCLVAALDCDVV